MEGGALVNSRFRLRFHVRILSAFCEYRWCQLPTRVAIDARAIDEERSIDIFRQSQTVIGHIRKLLLQRQRLEHCNSIIPRSSSLFADGAEIQFTTVRAGNC